MRKKILIALGVLVALPLLAVAALFAIREPPDGPRVEAEAGVVGIEAGGAYAWIVRTPHGAVLVDAGLDPDHYAAATLFPKARVLAGHGDIGMIRGDPTRYAAFGKLMSALLTMPPGPTEMTELRGGEELEFDGARFQVIAIPGHSPGSVMYLHEGVLFTGDSLLRKKEGVVIAPSLMSEDAEKNRTSLRTLGPLAFDTIADGHAGVTRDAKNKVARFLAGS